MKKIAILLLIASLFYSAIIYFNTSKIAHYPNSYASNGFKIWQEKNCQSCHQLYGLGGFMGPDLTNIISTPNKGKQYAQAFIANGSPKMPNMHLSEKEVAELINFLSWVDENDSIMIAQNN